MLNENVVNGQLHFSIINKNRIFQVYKLINKVKVKVVVINYNGVVYIFNPTVHYYEIVLG